MNIQEYISSGIVEAYILGVATTGEVREIEQLMTQYPELEAAVREQESLMGQHALMNAIAPPPQLKQKIWEALSRESGVMQDAETPIATPTPHIPLSSGTPKNNWLKYGMAASLALLIASVAGNVWMINDNQKKELSYTELVVKLSSENRVTLAALDKANNAMNVLTLPKLVKINLAGVGTHTAHSGMLYWDGATGDVYVDLNSMPKAPAGKQYQLWAIVDGKPVDAGMYDGNPMVAMHKMKTIPKAEMFAITIENEGGSPNPTLDQMVVAGKTS